MTLDPGGRQVLAGPLEPGTSGLRSVYWSVAFVPSCLASKPPRSPGTIKILIPVEFYGHPMPWLQTSFTPTYGRMIFTAMCRVITHAHTHKQKKLLNHVYLKFIRQALLFPILLYTPLYVFLKALN